jgi:hypothetical protein
MKRLNRVLTLTHRWLGVGLCLLFTLWFVSGAVMIFVPYPRLGMAERLAHAPQVDPAAVRITPAQAIAVSKVGDPARIRLVAGPRAPRYLIEPDSGPVVAVDAASGHDAAALTGEEAAMVAAAFAAQPVRAIDGPFERDLWVVHQRYDSRRPFYRVEVADSRGTELYVSARTGEVIQRTDRTARLWNYAGSIIHWVYIVPLRQHPILWADILWWVSWAGLGLTLSGIVLGGWRSAKALRIPGRRVITVFRGNHRYHHLFGLAVGLFTLTWMFSGLLAVDRGRIFPSGHPHGHLIQAFQGMSPAAAAASVSLADLGRVAPFSELEILPLGGRAWLAGKGASGQSIVAADDAGAAPSAVFAPDLLTKAIQAAWPGRDLKDFAPIPQGDFHAHLVAASRSWSDTLWRATLAGDQEIWVQVDTAEGRILTVMGPERRLQRWLYNGLHTFDLPGLRTSEFLRIGTELLLLSLGLVICVTGLLLGIRRLRLVSARRGAP